MNTSYRSICEEIEGTARGCERDPSDVSLVAVTKQVEWERVLPLYLEGQREFGESRVVEALEKLTKAPANCRWHFIGNLQKNKVRKVVGKFTLIHSVDSYDLAEKLSDVSIEYGKITSILLQANTSGELSKHGLIPDEWKRYFENILGMKGIAVKGLMTMAPLTTDEGIIRSCFSGLRTLRDELRTIAGDESCLPHLSMGMSHDFKIAIQEGATIIRIGSALNL